jgi:hypothetical protein
VKRTEELCSEPRVGWMSTTGEKVGEVDREKERRRCGRGPKEAGKRQTKMSEKTVLTSLNRALVVSVGEERGGGREEKVERERERKQRQRFD